MYCIPLLFPKLTDTDNQRVVDCYMSNVDSAIHPTGTLASNYRNLSEFKDSNYFFSSLFNGALDQEFINHMTIQRITGKFFAPHVDVYRKVSAMYTVKGMADTTFYNLHLKTIFKEIRSYKMELNQWYLFNNGEYHGVKNIEGNDRITLVIDLTDIFKTFDQAAQILGAKGLVQI